MHSIRSLITVAVTGVFIIGSFSGCAKQPEEELATAQAAIKAARDAEADKYMPNSFNNLQKAMETAEVEIRVQNSAFILSRNYTKAKQFLQNTRDLANQITADAPGAKAETKAQIEEGLASAQKLAKETRVDIRKAPRSKGKQLLAQMAADLDVAENELAQANTEFSAGNILSAREKLSKAQKLLKKIFDQLSTGGTDGLM